MIGKLLRASGHRLKCITLTAVKCVTNRQTIIPYSFLIHWFRRHIETTNNNNNNILYCEPVGIITTYHLRKYPDTRGTPNCLLYSQWLSSMLFYSRTLYSMFVCNRLISGTACSRAFNSICIRIYRQNHDLGLSKDLHILIIKWIHIQFQRRPKLYGCVSVTIVAKANLLKIRMENSLTTKKKNNNTTQQTTTTQYWVETFIN